MTTKIVKFTEPVWAAGLENTPIGPVSLAVTERGLVRVDWSSADALAETLMVRGDPRRAPETLEQALAWLKDYFEGGIAGFPVPIDMRGLTVFDQRVLRAAFDLKPAEVVTYTEMARRAGCSHAVRAVGTALGRNPMPIVIPCHRVVSLDGRLNRFGAPGGISVKAWLLTLEGCPVENGRCLQAIGRPASLEHTVK